MGRERRKGGEVQWQVSKLQNAFVVLEPSPGIEATISVNKSVSACTCSSTLQPTSHVQRKQSRHQGPKVQRHQTHEQHTEGHSTRASCLPSRAPSSPVPPASAAPVSGCHLALAPPAAAAPLAARRVGAEQAKGDVCNAQAGSQAQAELPHCSCALLMQADESKRRGPGLTP